MGFMELIACRCCFGLFLTIMQIENDLVKAREAPVCRPALSGQFVALALSGMLLIIEERATRSGGQL